MNSRAFFTLSFVLVLGAAGQAFAQADGNNATETVPRVIPYEGYLELDGGSYNADAESSYSAWARKVAADGAHASAA